MNSKLKETTTAAALPTDLRHQNNLTILKVFSSGEVYSANDVSALTGISRQTVMKAINSFAQKGLIASAGKGQSTVIGGKKPELFQFCMERYLLCIGLFGDEMVACIYDLTCKLIAQESTVFDVTKSVDGFFADIDTVAGRLFERVEHGQEKLYGVSLVVGGVIDYRLGKLKYSDITPSWGVDVPLKDILAERFPGAVIEVDNVAKMAACAAVLDNQEYGDCRVGVVYTDIGLSACYIDKGHVLHGANSLIGEIGHAVMDMSKMELYSYSREGCFERLVSEGYLNQMALEQPDQLSLSKLSSYGENIPLQAFFTEADQGDEYARQIVKYAAWVFSTALRNIVLNFDPHVVIIQGSYSHAGEWFHECLQKGIKCYSYYFENETFSLVYDKRPLRDLQMQGATMVLSREFFSSPEWL